jgi:chemotaxis protein MotB
MTQRRLKKQVSHDRWLVSYADFITLLFAFFVVLYSSSKADAHKQAQISASIDSAFRALGLFQGVSKSPGSGSGLGTPGTLPHLEDGQVSSMNIVMGDQLMATVDVQQDFAKIKKHLDGLLSNQIAQHIVSLKIGRDGLVISLREAGFYDSGSAAPHESSIATLDQIAAALSAAPYDIRIEGHTDNVPIHTAQFESNWELSTARATSLAKIFIVGHHFAPQRLSASGYAEFHPVSTNDTADGRGQNRRVDIIILPRSSLPQSTATVIPGLSISTVAAARR